MSDAISEFYRNLLEMVKQCERESAVDEYHPAPLPPAEPLTDQDRRVIVSALTYMKSHGCLTSNYVTRCEELIKKVEAIDFWHNDDPENGSVGDWVA